MPKIILVLLILLGAGYFLYSNVYNPKSYIDHDTVINGNYQVGKNKAVVIVAGSKLTVEGDVNIDGTLECDKGPIYLEVKGKLKVNGKLECNREEKEVAGKVGMGLVIIAKNNVIFDKNSKVLTNGHIQIVDSIEKIASDEQAVERVYEEILSDTDDGAMRIGPFVPEGSGKRSKTTSFNFPTPKINLVQNAKAANGEPDIHIAGDWKFGAPPRGTRRQIILVDPGAKSIKFDGSIEGPPGLDGEDILSGCNIDIPKEENSSDRKDKDALSARFKSGKIIIGNFKMILGKGGNGGNAATSKDCQPKAYAKAGSGGQSGNIKLSAQTEIIVEDSFTIIPGRGGNGGYAIATAKNGEDGNPGKNGSDAEAVGGNGADNIKSLKVKGNVAGLNKIIVGSVIAGDGGDATASPGNGGNGIGENCLGGLRGVGKATVGKGGRALFTYPPMIQSTSDAYDQDGQDGKKTVNTAKDGHTDSTCKKVVSKNDNKAYSKPVSDDLSYKDVVGINLYTSGGGSSLFATEPEDATILWLQFYTSRIKEDISKYFPVSVRVKVNGKEDLVTTFYDPSACEFKQESSPECKMSISKHPSWKGQKLTAKAYDSARKLIGLWGKGYGSIDEIMKN